MSKLYALMWLILADERGGAFGYSSLMLLVAIAALALLTQVTGAPT